MEDAVDSSVHTARRLRLTLPQHHIQNTEAPSAWAGQSFLVVLTPMGPTLEPRQDQEVM
jgi:hypothetical protein